MRLREEPAGLRWVCSRLRVPRSADSLSPTDSAVADLLESLDKCEAILASQRYIAGDVLTMSDIRLFMTLVRFDEVYVVYFKANVRFIHQYGGSTRGQSTHLFT